MVRYFALSLIYINNRNRSYWELCCDGIILSAGLMVLLIDKRLFGRGLFKLNSPLLGNI